MPKNKQKGSKIERELFVKFVENGFRAVRTAGSGTMENADCDLIAGNNKLGKYAIEVKSSKSKSKYISKDQIQRFKKFCEIIGLDEVVALRFNNQDWIFITTNDLRDCGKNYCITLEEAKQKGKNFSGFFLERK
jgi:Holliday junction resolvase